MTPQSSNLPQGWVLSRLSDFCDVILGQSPPSSTYNLDGKGLPFLQGKAEFGEPYPTPQKWCSAPGKVAEAGDVLLSVRAPVGPTNISFERTCIGRGLAAIRGQEGVEAGFLLYLLRAFEEEVAAQGTGTTFRAITGPRLRGMRLPLPPLAEQHRIVARIEELFSRLDAGVAALERVKAQVKRYRQAVLKAAFEGTLTAEWREAHRHELEPASALLERVRAEREKAGQRGEVRPLDTSELPELPEGWCYAHLEQLLAPTRDAMRTGPFGSLLKKHEHRTSGVPVLGIENLRQMEFVPGARIHVSEEKARELSVYDVHSGDILVSRSGTVGEICVVPDGVGPARFSTNLMRVRVDPSTVLPEFFCLLFTGCRFVLDQVEDRCKGSTRTFLNQTILRSLALPLPPLGEQAALTQRIARRFSLADAVEQAIDRGLRRAERLRQAILKRAFEGKLVPQDPSDEPAEELLERIRAARSEATHQQGRLL